MSYFLESHFVFAFSFQLGLFEDCQTWQVHLKGFPVALALDRGAKDLLLLTHPKFFERNKWKILSRTVFAFIWWGMVCNEKVVLAEAFKEFCEYWTPIVAFHYFSLLPCSNLIRLQLHSSVREQLPSPFDFNS